jgi:hypothetical protein
MSTNPSNTQTDIAGGNLKKESQISPYQNKLLEDMKAEFWQEIPAFEGFLLLSNFWRLNSLGRYVERRNGSNGYWTKDKILSPVPRQISA